MHPMLHPADIQAIGHEIAIRWSDGAETYYPMEKLRALSPSAETTGERDLLGVKYGGDDRKEYPGVRVSIGTTELDAKHIVVTEPSGATRDVWVDAKGRVLKVAIPSRNVVALRDDPPVP